MNIVLFFIGLFMFTVSQSILESRVTKSDTDTNVSDTLAYFISLVIAFILMIYGLNGYLFTLK